MKLCHSLFTALLCATLTIGAGCGTTSDLVDDGKAVLGVEINSDKNTMSMGSTIQLHAVLRYADADGTTKDVTRDAVWNTSDPDVATVSKEGLVTTLKEGIVDIFADYKGEKAGEHFAVTP